MVRRVKKKKSGIRIFVTFLLMVGITAFVYKYVITLGYQNILERKYDDKTSAYSSLKMTPNSSDADKTPATPKKELCISPDKLNSPNAILIRLKDNTVVMQKNCEKKIFPASMTKIMTAIVAIENLPDLKEEIKLTNSMFEGLFEANAALAGFQPGENVRGIDLIYGVLLPSGAESCIALANQIAGSEQGFVKMMNQKAVDLSMDNTHFENTTGLHDENHYTTVKDLTILLSYALQNDTFREVFTSPRHSTGPTNRHPDGITFYSTMFKGLKDQYLIGGEILGGKTGYTDEAGLCLASLAKVGKQEYILVSAGAKGDNRSEQFNITDAIAVYSSLGK